MQSLGETQPSDTSAVSTLEADELAALTSAATWYANYHAGIIADRADDDSAYAVAQRERYSALVTGLRKLGIRLPPADTTREESRQAA